MESLGSSSKKCNIKRFIAIFMAACIVLHFLCIFLYVQLREFIQQSNRNARIVVVAVKMVREFMHITDSKEAVSGEVIASKDGKHLVRVIFARTYDQANQLNNKEHVESMCVLLCEENLYSPKYELLRLGKCSQNQPGDVPEIVPPSPTN